MDWKSIGLNSVKMKFFLILLISSFLVGNSVDLYGARDIPEPSYLLYCPYSKLHSQLPKNDDPNISYLILEIPAEEVLKSDLLAFSQEYLYSTMGGIQYACEYDPCLILLSKCGHSHYHISESKYLDTYVSSRLSKHDNDISLPKLYDMLDYLLYVNSFDILPYCKSKTFIETKVAAMKLQGFNH